MQKILVSACLLGQPVRYDGAGFAVQAALAMWQAQGRVVSLCPEVAGGLSTPRPAAEIIGGQGRAVWQGQAQVVTVQGADVSGAFIAGAEAALALCRAHGIAMAILKARSPSCGNQQTYDGHFRGALVAGEGVTACYLQQAGIEVFNETELEQAQLWLDALEAQA